MTQFKGSICFTASLLTEFPLTSYFWNKGNWACWASSLHSDPYCFYILSLIYPSLTDLIKSTSLVLTVSSLWFSHSSYAFFSLFQVTFWLPLLKMVLPAKEMKEMGIQ